MCSSLINWIHVGPCFLFVLKKKFETRVESLRRYNGSRRTRKKGSKNLLSMRIYPKKAEKKNKNSRKFSFSLHFMTSVLLIFQHGWKKNLFYVGTNWVLSVHNNRNSCSLFAHIALLMTVELLPPSQPADDEFQSRFYCDHKHTLPLLYEKNVTMISNRQT